MYDAIIVGARCAGSATAMLLARKGYRVLAVDRATFPSDIMSTHLIKHEGIRQLSRWGLLERVAATGCPPITEIVLDYRDFALRGFAPDETSGVTALYCPRRTALDKVLVDAAREAGAEVREAFTVDELVMEDGRVAGVRGHHRGSGGSITERARIVIGADGLHSLVARSVDAPRYQEVPALECGYYSYWSGVPCAGVELYFRERRIIFLFATNHGQTCIAVTAPVEEFHAFRADIEGSFFAGLGLVESMVERVRAGRREERWIGTADLPNFFRKPFGPGWALVGDAGYHKDPAAGDGISDAFRDAELLAEALDAGFTGRQDLHEALTGYEQTRNAASQANYERTTQLASHQPLPPAQRMLLHAISRNPEETNRFFAVTAGLIPAAAYFAPANVMRILRSAGLSGAPAAPGT